MFKTYLLLSKILIRKVGMNCFFKYVKQINNFIAVYTISELQGLIFLSYILKRNITENFITSEKELLIL